MKGRAVIRFVLVMSLLALLSAQAWGKVVRVDGSAPGPVRDGLSWTTAFATVQEGIDAASAGDNVWVAEGSYPGGVALKDGVAILGGFFAGATLPSQRDPEGRVTILDGNGAGSVVTIDNCPSPLTRVDGFTIRNGSGTSFEGNPSGGGIFCRGSQPVIHGNTITGNRANTGGGIFATDCPAISVTGNTITGNDGAGGGIYYISSSGEITANTISNNTTSGGGGGIFLIYGSDPRIEHNDISGNHALGGAGGICCNESSPRIAYNRISGNHSTTGAGGGIYFSASAPVIVGNIITENSVDDHTLGVAGGGIMCENGLSGFVIANNVIARNSVVIGGGIFVGYAVSGTIANNTIVGNIVDKPAGGRGGAIYFNTYSTPLVAGNIIAFNTDGVARATIGVAPVLRGNDFFGNPGGDYLGLSPGSGDFSADPLFVDNLAGDYHLTVGSPCVDAGDNTVVAADWTDIDGEGRIQKGHPAATEARVDVGADELDIRPPSTSVSLSGLSGRDGWYLSPVTVGLTATDGWFDNSTGSPVFFEGTGVAATEYGLDGLHWTPYAGPFSLSDGQYVLDFRSTDRAGNVESARQTVIKVDATAPAFVSSVPANGATGVSTATAVRLTFSENVQAEVAYGSITFRKGTTAVAFTKTLAGNVLTLTPSKALSRNTLYTIGIPAGAVGDMPGNVLKSPVAIQFRTGNR